MQPKEFYYTPSTHKEWKKIMNSKLQTAKTFEIHCWNEEIDWIEFALKFGKLKDFNWRYGKVISGDVTKDFVGMLLNMPKPMDIEIYNKMTPFFSIFLDNGFASAHYGTELIQH